MKVWKGLGRVALLALLAALLLVGPALPSIAAAVQDAWPFSDPAELASGTVTVAENDRLQLLLDEQSLSVTVRDKRSGEQWRLTPDEADSDMSAAEEEINRMKSLVVLEYYDLSGTVNRLDAFSECVDKGQYALRRTEDGFSVQLTIGDSGRRQVVPLVISREAFEQEVLANLQDNARALRRLEYFYLLQSLSDCGSEQEKQDLLKEYPGAAYADLYAAAALNSREREELEAYFLEAGFTAERMEQEYALLHYEEEETVRPSFRLTLHFSLTEYGLCVAIPGEGIVFDRTKYSLHSIQLMPFFGAMPESSGGFLLLPDGCGTRIDADGSRKSQPLLTGEVYGRDLANGEENAGTTSFPLPLWGIHSGKADLLAVITQGAGAAVITAENAGYSHSYYTAYATFIYQNMLTLQPSGTADEGFTMFEKSPTLAAAQVDYRLLDGEAEGLPALAAAYRSLLQEQGFPTQPLSGELPLFVTTLGSIDVEQNVAGIRFDQNRALTTFEDDIAILDQLRAQGISHVAMELEGYANGGLNHTAFSKLSIMGNLGGAKGLTSLVAHARENGAVVFPGVDVSFVYRQKLWDGYDAKRDGSRMLDGKVAFYGISDLVTGEESRKLGRVTVNIRAAARYYEAAAKVLRRMDAGAVSLGELGRFVSSDIRKKNSVSRDREIAGSAELMKKAAAAGDVMVTGGNGYSLPYAGYIRLLPGDNSGIHGLGRQVPFLQMVLHGYVEYTIETVNFQENTDASLLRSIAMGASPEFTVAMRNLDRLREDDIFSSCYSVGFSRWKSEMAEAIKKARAVLEPVRGAEMISWEEPYAGVYRVGYDNGKTVYVNLTDTDYTHEGVPVSAGEAMVR